MPVTRKPYRDMSLEEFLAIVPPIAGGDPQGDPNEEGQAAPGSTPPEPKPDSASEPKPAEGEDALPDAVKAILRKERSSRRDAEKLAREAQERAQSYEDRDKTDLQKANERAERAEREAAELRSRELRLRVATATKLPAELADRLQGSTEDELTADAERLAELFKAQAGSSSQPAGSGFDGGQKSTTGAALTRAQIEAMSPEEINRRWPEVQDALARS